MRHTLRLKRAYDPPAENDGQRILVDRLWPRGLSKAGAQLDLWMKDIAPTTELRRWFGHRPERWPDFRARYRQELRSNPALEPLRQFIAAGPVTLIYGAKDRDHNDAVVLVEFLDTEG
jgi:uncharacterized protein YeaO (DUF488 family)